MKEKIKEGLYRLTGIDKLQAIKNIFDKYKGRIVWSEADNNTYIIVGTKLYIVGEVTYNEFTDFCKCNLEYVNNISAEYLLNILVEQGMFSSTENPKNFLYN